MSEKRVLQIVLFLPFIHSIADVTVNYFKTGSATLFHPGIIRGLIVIILVLYFVSKHIVINKSNLIIYIFIGYMSFLIVLSSNIVHSFFSGYIKWSTALMMFPVGYYYIRSDYLFRKLNMSYIWSAVIISCNLIIAQVFKIGSSSYIEDSFYLGGAGVGIPNSLTIILLIFPIFLNKEFKLVKKKKWFLIILLFISIILVFLSMKRAAIFGLMFGFLVYSYFSYRKVKIFKFVLLAIIVIISTFPYYEDLFMARFAARTTERNKFENESRYREIFYVLNELESNSVEHAIIGSELFNSQHYFGPKYFGRGRMIHGDLTSFLYGSGIIGLLLYLLIYLTLFRENLRLRKKIKRNNFLIDINAVFFGILACAFLISVTGSGSIGERSLIYLYLGALFSVQKIYANRLGKKRYKEK